LQIKTTNKTGDTLLNSNSPMERKVLAVILSALCLSACAFLPSCRAGTITFETVEKNQNEITIPLRQCAEFDFKTKQEIYRIRRECVMQYPQYAPANYSPSEAVFGPIEGNKVWYGLLGISYYSTGPDINKGESEESRFILNPLLLIGLDHARLYAAHGISKLPPVPIYPEPVSLYIDETGSKGRVVYNVTNYWNLYRRYYRRVHLEHEFFLSVYNARDLGYKYTSLAGETKNVVIHGLDKIVELIQFIHCANCGYPNKCCNNMSPQQAEMNIDVQQLPARISFKLWKEKPSSAQDTADRIFTIDMI
jgi:hypothetical protein